MSDINAIINIKIHKRVHCGIRKSKHQQNVLLHWGNICRWMNVYQVAEFWTRNAESIAFCGSSGERNVSQILTLLSVEWLNDM
jgi:hypothetical protein